MKISKRDIKYVLLGMFLLLVLEIMFNWSSSISNFKRGLSDGYNKSTVK
jgi:hypothetical protein